MLSKAILYFLGVALIVHGKGVTTEMGGVINLELLCFQNYGHLNINGQVCDSAVSKQCSPYFRICISDKSISGKLNEKECPIYFKKTSQFHYPESICNLPDDNRNSMAEVIERTLSFPLKDVYYVKINVKDGNQNSQNLRYISYFSYTFRGAPYAYSEDRTYTEILMPRYDKDYKNINASLRIAISVTCKRNSKLCSSYCKYLSRDNYTCSNDGMKICKPGYDCFKDYQSTTNTSNRNTGQLKLGLSIFACLLVVIIILSIVVIRKYHNWIIIRLCNKKEKSVAYNPKPFSSQCNPVKDDERNEYDVEYEIIKDPTSEDFCSDYAYMGQPRDGTNNRINIFDPVPPLPPRNEIN